jgi:phospholipase C
LPFLIISPYAKVNFIDHTISDQSSIPRLIEDNWGLGRIRNQSFDAKADSLMNVFDFTAQGHHADKLLLNPSSGLQTTSTVMK